MSSPEAAANNSTADRRAWLESFLELPTDGSGRQRCAPRIGTVLGLYLTALLITGSAATSLMPYGVAAATSPASHPLAATTGAATTDAGAGPVAPARKAHRPLPLQTAQALPRQPAAASAAAADADRMPPASSGETRRQTLAVQPQHRHRLALQPATFQGLLEPAGIGRRFWRSFDHIPPQTGPVEPPARYVVLLDPGHGGSDPGSIGRHGLQEKHLTLDIARRAALFLAEIDEIEVQLTRDDDTGMARRQRVSKVRRSEADLVVSLHLNHLPQSDVTLTETYHAGREHLHAPALETDFLHTAATGRHADRAASSSQPDGAAFVAASARLADIVQQSVFNEVRYDNPSAINAGVKQRGLYVLNRSATPGILVELTCLSNPREERRLATEAYRNRLAAAVADGIRAYLADTDPLLIAENTI